MTLSRVDCCVVSNSKMSTIVDLDINIDELQVYPIVKCLLT